MPELPDVELYLSALRPRVLGHAVQRTRVASPFFVRTYEPPLTAIEGRVVMTLARLGKRLVFGFEDDLFVVVHLMIAGRLRWLEPGAKIPAKVGLAAFDFSHATLLFTEAGSRKQASLHVVVDTAAVEAMDPGGADVFALTLEAFATAITAENHTLKRVLTDPRVFSGIGNAYSDEILHAARLSPVKLSRSLDADEMMRLFSATREVLALWTARLQEEAGGEFPERVTAFRPDMAVHGKYGKPCPRCGAPVQRIVYATNESNYCAACQTGGRLLADRALSRLLREDWPKTVDALEQAKRR
jgi:formamidopyrimidine-DNA glycosylase